MQKKVTQTTISNRDSVIIKSTKWRHKKRGTTYIEIGRGLMQDHGTDLDDEPVVIYRGEDGRLWVRTVDQFEDGRFARVE